MPKQKSDTKNKHKKPRKTKKNEVEQTKYSVNIPSVAEITKQSFMVLWKHKKLFGTIVLIYGIAYLILVQGLSGPGNVSNIKADLSSGNGHLGSLYSGVGVFTYLLGSSSSSSGSSSFQVIVIILASLAVIWALRRVYNNEKIRARDAFYKGPYPLVQYVLILLFIAVELFPLILGLGLYVYLIQDNLAVNIFEQILSLIVALGFAAISFYLVTASIMSTYIVTLADMTPVLALKTGKKLVTKRRLLIFRKLIFLPLLLFVVIGIIMLPFILVLPILASWIFFILCLFALTYIHSYCFTLYRGLMNE